MLLRELKVNLKSFIIWTSILLGMFLIVYLILVLTFGFSLLITDIAIGRKTGKSSLEAFKAVREKFDAGYYASMPIPQKADPEFKVR